jgi:hypothetical protein
MRRHWLLQVVVYSAAGLLASGLVGLGLGAIGYPLASLTTNLWGPVGIATALALLVRELGWVRFPLPQAHRQTDDRWAKIFPSVAAAGLWGFDIGLTLSTWMTFSGAWLLIVLAIVSGSPSTGALLLGSYWLGRALSVWIVPAVLPGMTAAPQVIGRVLASRPSLRRIHLAGLAWIALALAWQLRPGCC